MAASIADASEGTYENAHISGMQKTIRSITKKLAGMQKTDSVIAANPGVSLDELVAQRKINQDQKASALKKPQLQAQQAQLAEQVQLFKQFDGEHQAQIKKVKDEAEAKTAQEVEKVRKEVESEVQGKQEEGIRGKLLTLSQFLRAAAARRNEEEDASTDEDLAFEGALLLVYGGDQTAVDTALDLIEGSEKKVLSIEGNELPVKYSQIKQASVEHAPPPPEDTSDPAIDDTPAIPDTTSTPHINGDSSAVSDPTVANAGLTELNTTVPQTNGTSASHHDLMSPVQATTGESGGNAAGDRWDTNGGADKDTLEDDNSYEIIPRPNDEVDIPAPTTETAAPQTNATSWAEDAQQASHEPPAGNTAGEAWDTKAAGDSSAPAATPSTGTPVSGVADDGFQEIPNRHRGRGGFRGGRGGEGGDRGFRGGRGGRGGSRGSFRGRGDGEYRGRGDGEYRGRGGRGRGAPRGDAAPRT
ncbi:hypothetical protein LTR95_010856 [Oleoguttula sp. CCFEE 5521]